MIALRWRAVTALACLSLAMAAPVQACGLDGIPSISGNGTLAHRNTERATASSLGRWAPFVFNTPYRVGQTVLFSENLAELRRTLLPQGFGHPWRWRFGDGTTTTGFSVRHVYRKSGQYKVSVFAYYSSYKAWFEFDDVLLRVR